MGKYDFEEALSDSDGDEFLQDEIRTLSMACMPSNASDAGGNPSTSFPGTNLGDFSDDDDDDDGLDDDLELVRSIREQYGSGVDIARPLSLKPLTSLPPVSSDDDDDDFETLRAIQRRFSQYCGGDTGTDDDAIESKNSSCVGKPQQNDAIGTSLGSECLEVRRDDFGQKSCDVTESMENSSCTSSFPTAAQTFMEAIKKNRSCQKLIRNKMLHIEARMEEIKELQKRLKTLRDFQVQCKKKIGRALSQKQDARVQLILAPKQRANVKGSEKNVSAMFYGPLENSHVSWYKTTTKHFPLSFQREKWSKDEIQKLEKGIINQFRGRLFEKSTDVLSALEEPGFAHGVDDMISSITNLDITPEIIQDFSSKVDWNQLASEIPRRSGAECKARWLNYENGLINRDSWTSEEDKRLLLLIQKHGIHDWSFIAEKLETNRTPFQCLTRYQRSLNASILKREWTEDEDAQLRSAVESFGESNWQAVASVLEGRTGTQCSNRWKKTLLPARQRVGKWSDDEDKRLRVAVTLFGYKSWHKIFQFVPGRTQAQCRERWVNSLDPSVNRGEWTEDEDMRLKAAIDKHGYCWSKVAACVSLRTDNQCRRRWKSLFPNEVSLLKAARDIKKAALISNFVDRESERPALGPNDFIALPIADSTYEVENKNASQVHKKSRKSTQAHPNRESVSRCGLKRVGSRKRKKSNISTKSNSDWDDIRSNNGYGIHENKKRKARKSGSENKEHRGNLTTEPKMSCESTESCEDRETGTWDIPISIRSRSPRGVRLKEISSSRHRCVSQTAGIHDTDMYASAYAHCSNQNNVPEQLHGQSSDSQSRIHDEEMVVVPSIVTVAREKVSSKLQPRRALAKTTLDNNDYEMELRTSNDDNAIQSLHAAGSTKPNDVKQKKSNSHIDESIKWEDLPLSILFKSSVSRIQRRISSVGFQPPIYGFR